MIVTERKAGILFLNLCLKVSGAEFSLLNLIKHLDRTRFIPHMLLAGSGPLAEIAEREGIPVIVLPELKQFEGGFHIVRFPELLWTVWRVGAIIRKNKIDLVHCNSPRAAYIGGAAARLAGIPSVIHVRDIVFSPFASALKSRFLNWVSDSIITVSDATRLSVIRRYPRINQKTHTIVNGVDIGHMDGLPVTNVRGGLGVGDIAPLVGSVGMISEVKGNDVLIRALAIVKRSFPEIRALIVGAPFHPGDAKYFCELKELVGRLGLEANVVFPGFREDVLDLIRSLDLLVHPAVYPDPLPRVLLEAAALRIPIVATRVGGVPEIIEDGKSGVLVDPGDPEALAQGIMGLLEDKVKARRLAETARKRVEEFFSIQGHVDRVMAIYRKILDLN
jgi:glycosyltransferase involved in cell wall biosynthesis